MSVFAGVLGLVRRSPLPTRSAPLRKAVETALGEERQMREQVRAFILDPHTSLHTVVENVRQVVFAADEAAERRKMRL